MNGAIAQHLNILESAIVRIEEWAKVLFVVVRGVGGRFVSKKVAKVKKEWQDKNNLVIKHYVFPVGDYSDYGGFLGWGRACDDAKAGLIPSVNRYEVVYYSGGGIWCIAGSVSTMDEAIALANAQSPARWDGGIKSGYAVTSTGKTVFQADWDDIEGDM